MMNQISNQRGIQMVDMIVIINRYSFYNQHEGPNKHPVNVGCSNFSFTKQQCIWDTKKWTRQDNKNVKAILH